MIVSFGLSLFQFSLEPVWMGLFSRLAPCDQVVVEYDLVVCEIAQTVAVKDDDMAQVRHVVFDFQILIKLLVVFHEQNGRAAVIDQIGQLLWRCQSCRRPTLSRRCP